MNKNMITSFPKLSPEFFQKEYIARELHKISKQDLIAAKVLYHNELYPEALFFLQQSIEKGYKSYHLLSELGTSPENMPRKYLSIRNIGHIPTKITEKQASDAEDRFSKIKKDIDLFPNPDEIYGIIGVDFSELIQQFSDLKKILSEISSDRDISKKMRLYVLDNMLDDLYPIIKMSSRATRNIKGIIFNEATKEKMIKKTLETISPFLKFSPDLALEETNKVYNIFGKDFPKFEPVLKIIIQNRFELGCINVIYTNLSFITQGHESSTRYPEINNSPLTIYTQHHPLIRRFNALTRLAGIAHRKFDNILSSSEKLQKNNVPSTNFSTPP